MASTGQHFQLFLSVVITVKNRSSDLKKILPPIIDLLSSMVSDFELILVDNASTDTSHLQYTTLTSTNGFPNLQVYALTKEVDTLTANWIGIERALGDIVVTIDPFTEDITIMPTLIAKAMEGNDVVFARNTWNIPVGYYKRLVHKFSFRILKLITGIKLKNNRPNYQLVTKRIVNFLLQHPQPILAYKGLSTTGFFSQTEMSYEFPHQQTMPENFWSNMESAMKLLFATTQAPMRIVTVLSLFGACMNLIYSVYVITIGIFKEDVEPGWVSLSLQQSGMFFLISMVLLVLGEYLLHMVRLSNEGPPYHIGKEYVSTNITRNNKLNVTVNEKFRRE